MDRDLLRQSLGCHGPALLSLLRNEQQDNPHFRSLLGTAAEPARGAAPPPGAGRYGGRNPGRGAGWTGKPEPRGVWPGTGSWPNGPVAPSEPPPPELPCSHSQVARPERVGLKLLPELSG